MAAMRGVLESLRGVEEELGDIIGELSRCRNNKAECAKRLTALLGCRFTKDDLSFWWIGVLDLFPNSLPHSI